MSSALKAGTTKTDVTQNCAKPKNSSKLKITKLEELTLMLDVAQKYCFDKQLKAGFKSTFSEDFKVYEELGRPDFIPRMFNTDRKEFVQYVSGMTKLEISREKLKCVSAAWKYQESLPEKEFDVSFEYFLYIYCPWTRIGLKASAIELLEALSEDILDSYRVDMENFCFVSTKEKSRFPVEKTKETECERILFKERNQRVHYINSFKNNVVEVPAKKTNRCSSVKSKINPLIEVQRMRAFIRRNVLNQIENLVGTAFLKKIKIKFSAKLRTRGEIPHWAVLEYTENRALEKNEPLTETEEEHEAVVKKKIDTEAAPTIQKKTFCVGDTQERTEGFPCEAPDYSKIFEKERIRPYPDTGWPEYAAIIINLTKTTFCPKCFHLWQTRSEQSFLC